MRLGTDFLKRTRLLLSAHSVSSLGAAHQSRMILGPSSSGFEVSLTRGGVVSHGQEAQHPSVSFSAKYGSEGSGADGLGSSSRFSM